MVLQGLTRSAQRASAASGAVSARSTRGPRVIGRSPRCARPSSSAGREPPSGPDSSVNGPAAAPGSGSALRIRRQRQQPRSPACGSERAWQCRQPRRRVRIGICTGGTRLRPHCSQAAIAMPCQCACFLLGPLAVQPQHAALAHQGLDARGTELGGLLDQPVHPLVGRHAEREVDGAPASRSTAWCCRRCTLHLAAAHAARPRARLAAVAVEQRERARRAAGAAPAHGARRRRARPATGPLASGAAQ